MVTLNTLWHSADAERNALALRLSKNSAFQALAEVDKFGHRLLTRCGDARISDIDRLVGIAMLRRAVTLFVGLRHLLEASSVEPGKLVARALFETMLAFRYIIHGARRRVDACTPSDHRAREARARYYLVAAKRNLIYSRQAVLDGRWGRGQVTPKMRRSLKREVASETARLARDFPTQSCAFGPFRFAIPSRRRIYFDTKQWYSFGFRKGDVTSVRALALRVGWIREYELLYGAFSGIMHPRGISHDVKVAEGAVEVFHPYMAEAFDLLSFLGCTWQMYALGAAAKAYNRESLADARDVHAKIRPFVHGPRPAMPDGLV